MHSGVGLDGVVDDLLDTNLSPLSDPEVQQLLEQVERAQRRLAAVSLRIQIEATERSLPQRAALTPQKWLVHTLHISAGEANRRTMLARALGTWHTVNGDELEPPHAYVADALADGGIGVEHSTRILAAVNRIPTAVNIADRDTAEQILTQLARGAAPTDVEKAAARVLAWLDPDGKLTDDHDRNRRRGFTLYRQDASLMSVVRGELDPAARAVLEPLLAKWARPGMNNPTDPDGPRGDCEHVDRDALAAAAARDTRTTAQRNHDALVAIASSVTASGAEGTHRGLPVMPIMTMTVDQLERSAGVATTATGGLVPIKDALRMAEQVHPVLAVLDHNSRPLHLGRGKRLATQSLRLALIAADRGCTRPGCDAPPTMCAAHHVRDYAKGGRTDIDNLALACDPCHALVNASANGWSTSKHSRIGRTIWIDPTGTADINHRHHPEELLAGARKQLKQQRRSGDDP